MTGNPYRRRRPPAAFAAPLLAAFLLVCSAPGVHAEPTLTERLVFATDRDVQPDIDLVSLGLREGDLRKLTNSPEWDEYEPQASYDGRRVVFVRTPVGKRWPDHEPADLWVINADGSGLHRITDTPDVDEWDPALSPDGSQVTFTTLGVAVPGGDAQAVWVVDLDGGNRREVIRTDRHVETVSWSPDGRQIAYAYCACRVTGYGATIWVVNVDGSGARQLSDPRPTTGWDARPRWSPDGNRLVFARQSEDMDWSLWMMNADGADEHQLTSHPLYMEHAPNWSPDGSRIAFARQPTPAFSYLPLGDAARPTFSEAGIWVMTPDGSRQTLLTKPSWPWDDWIPVWTLVASESPALHPPPPVASHDVRPDAERAPRVSILSRALRMSRSGVVRVRLRCLAQRGMPCRGRLVLRAGSRQIGRAPFAIPAGASEAVRLRLSARSRRLVRGRGLRVRVIALNAGQVSRTVRLRSAR